MPDCKAYWRGCPYHRLPRIRVPSSHAASIAACSISTLSIQTFRKPQNPNLEQERMKQRIKLRFQRRKERSSRTSSSEARARRRASRRARDNIQVFGWTTPGAELASRVTTEIVGSTSSIEATLGAQPKHGTALQAQPTRSTITRSTNCTTASTSKWKRIPSHAPQNLYSLMQTAEVPVYWTAKGKPKRISTLNPNRVGNHSTGKPSPEYAHTGSVQIVSKKGTTRSSKTAERSQTYELRTTLNNRVPKDRRIRSTIGSKEIALTRSTIATSRIPSKNKYRKHPSFENLAYRGAINSFALQSKLDGSMSPSIRSFVQSVLTETDSRTASQKRAIKRFTKELDSYLQTIKPLSKQTLISSASSSSISAHTVKALKPYQSEFEAAGLAVTSAVQKRKSKIELPSPPPTPPKDKKWTRNLPLAPPKMAPSGEKKLGKPPPKGKQPSFASGSTGTDVIGFTPPHEKTYARGAVHQRHSSSEGSVLGWTPPHERSVALPPKSAPLIPTVSKSKPSRLSFKKSLPWLKKPEFSPESSAISKNKTAVANSKAPSRPSDPLKGWIDSYDIRNIPPPPEFKKRNESAVTPHGGLSYRSTEARFRDRRDDIEKTKQSPTPHIRPETMIAKESPLVETIVASRNISSYVDAAIQTNRSEIAREKSSVPRAPITNGRIRTYPLNPNRCKGNCSGTKSEPISVTSLGYSQPSNVPRKGAENYLQTEPCASIEPKANQSIQRNESDFTAVDQLMVDRGRAIPFAVSNGRSSEPLQSSPALRSFNKPMDQCKLLISNMEVGPIETQVTVTEPQMSTRQPPSPPLDCTNCACHLASKISNSEPSPPPLARPEQKEVEVDYTLSRQSTRPIIPAGEFAYQNGPVLGENPNEIRYIEKTIEEYTNKEPVADPMKKLSISCPKPTTPLGLREELKSHTRPKPRSLFPIQPKINNTSPVPFPPSETTTDSCNFSSDKISNNKVFMGLHVVTAAACDKDVDKWIEEITGCSARKFLNDLSAFNGLGVNALAGVAKRAAKQRSAKVKAWETTRERILEKTEWEDVGGDAGNDAVEGQDGRLYFVANSERKKLKDAKKGLIGKI